MKEILLVLIVLLINWNLLFYVLFGCINYDMGMGSGWELRSPLLDVLLNANKHRIVCLLSFILSPFSVLVVWLFRKSLTKMYIIRQLMFIVVFLLDVCVVYNSKLY